MRAATRLATLFLVAALPLALAGCGRGEVVAPKPEVPKGSTAAPAPDVILLPVGFRPEGIAEQGGFIFVGSIPTGAVYRADIASGEGTVVVTARQGRAAIGLKIDDRSRIFVAGGPTGKAFVYDAVTGLDKAEYTLTTATQTFVNDVVLAGDDVWFTDSRNPVLYRVRVPTDGSFGGQDAVSTLRLSGDFKFQPGVNNMNGIAWSGERLICVQSSTGMLFSVDPETGVTKRIDLGAETVENGDGLLLDGRTLFVVQNRRNLVAVIDLAADLSSGKVRIRVPSPAFDVPTTVAGAGASLYLPNARFTTTPTPDTTYSVVRIDRP